MLPDPRRRPLVAILVIGLAATFFAGTAGLLFERLRLGATDTEAAARVEREVRARFERVSAALGRAAADLALASAPVIERPADERDVRPLFERAEAITAGGEAADAITVYGADGAPVAWSGRPSQLPLARLQGSPGLFLTPGPLGIRLVRTVPVVSPGGRVPLGTVAAERLLTVQGVSGRTPAARRMETPLAQVSLRPKDEALANAMGPHLRDRGPAG